MSIFFRYKKTTKKHFSRSRIKYKIQMDFFAPAETSYKPVYRSDDVYNFHIPLAKVSHSSECTFVLL